MRKRLHRLLMMITAAILTVSMGVTCFAAPEKTARDTIYLEPEAGWEDEVPVDLSWKTQQDQGRWIDAMGIAGDANSLIVILNNMGNGSEQEIPRYQPENKITMSRKRKEVGNSRLHYYSRSTEGQWSEVFAVNCNISGGAEDESSIYGVYRLDSAFGSEKDPGSLVPYHKLTFRDYWVTDTQDENFGSIFTATSKDIKKEAYIRLEDMRAFSNYGMILKPEEDGEAYPALVVNCQQPSVKDNTFSGIQLIQTYVRMLIQSIDSGTRIMITDNLEYLEELAN